MGRVDDAALPLSWSVLYKGLYSPRLLSSRTPWECSMLLNPLVPCMAQQPYTWYRSTLWNTPTPSTAPGLPTQNPYTLDPAIVVIKIHLNA